MSASSAKASSPLSQALGPGEFGGAVGAGGRSTAGGRGASGGRADERPPQSAAAIWVAEAVENDERAGWASELAAILAGLPLPDPQRPTTHAPPRAYPDAAGEPMSYRPGSDPYVGDAPSVATRLPQERSRLPVHRLARKKRLDDELSVKASVRAKRSASVAGMDAEATSRTAAIGAADGAACQPGASPEKPPSANEPVVIDRVRRARPGRGGRQRRRDAASETTATAELEEKLGPPDFINARGVQMMSWTAERSKPGNGILHADGDGILVGRLSSNDLQAGETVMGQVHGLLALRQSAGLRAREILTTTRNSGYLPYEARVDFAHIADEIAAGRINWVAWRAPERVGRDLLPVLRFYKLLQDTNTDLYLTNLGRLWIG